MKQFLFVFITLFLFSGVFFAQEDHFLTPRNKAYIYHTVRKSPILEKSIGRYVVYMGEEIKFPNGEINYDSTELVIINNPEKLKIYTYDIQKAPKGLLAELANKMAIWELNSTLQAHRSNLLVKEGWETEYERFEKILMGKLPAKAIKVKKDEPQVLKKIERISNPTLTFKDKTAMLDGLGKSWSEEEKQMVIRAFNATINEWVAERTQEIFTQLGGEADFFLNILTAAGDGSSTSGLFEEREKDERGRWNRGLPRAVGLFPYETHIVSKQNSKKKKPELLPLGYTIHQFETAGEGRETNIHLDVWGYNSEKQTTVVITKGGKYYPLFGSVDSRFLTPDSSFGGGLTYYTLIHRVERDIVELEEKISGKRGIDFLIKQLEDKEQSTKLAVDKVEKEINDIRHSTITTKGTTLKTDSRQKQRKKRQEKVVAYYNELRSIKGKIKALKEEKENLLFNKQNKERKLQEMLDLIGKEWVPYKEKDGLYLFQDSTRFDILTQEFVFPASDDKEIAQVKLIAIPVSHLNEQYDEVMLHINVTDAIPHYSSQIQLQLNDVFEVDKYVLSDALFAPKDSIAVLEFLEALYDKKKTFTITARGGGVGKWKNDRVSIDYEAEELSSYPGTNETEREKAKQDYKFKRLRTTEVLVHIDREIKMEVNSYTDPVRSNFQSDNKKLQTLKQQHNLSGNQLLSAYRTYATLKALKAELNVLASKYLPREKSSKVIDRLNKAVDKTKITVGRTSVKMKSFE